MVDEKIYFQAFQEEISQNFLQRCWIEHINFGGKKF